MTAGLPFAEQRVSEKSLDQQPQVLNSATWGAIRADWLSPKAASIQVTSEPAGAPELRQAAN